MPELTRQTFVDLWTAAKAGQKSPEQGLARMQKFMVMHDDLHPNFDRIAADPNESLEIRGENIVLHIAMDAATEESLEADDPAGVRLLMHQLLDAKFETGQAFHLLSQAMMHEFLTASGENKDMDKHRFLARAQSYAEQAKTQRQEAQQQPEQQNG